MEKNRDPMKVVRPISIREPIGHTKLRIEDSKAAQDVEIDQVSTRIQIPDTACAEVNTMEELHTKAMEINSADEVRQAIKAALTKKSMIATQNVGTDMTELVPSLRKEVLVPKEIPVPREIPILKAIPVPKEISVSEIQDYKPERGAQVHATQKSRKRPGNPTKAGPAKRPKAKAEIIDDFYVGKLCNLVAHTKKFSPKYF